MTVDASGERTGGELVVEGLRRWGVDVVFGLPGVQLDGLYEGFALEPSIRVIHTRHEQATSYMADGYSRVDGSRRCVRRRAGAGRAQRGCRAGDRVRVWEPRALHRRAGARPADLGRGRGVLHEIPDQQAMLRGVIGRSEYATVPRTSPVSSTRCSPRSRATSVRGRTRSRWAGTPCSVVRRRRGHDKPDVPGPKQPDLALIDEAAGVLTRAQRPVILAGGGALGGAAPLVALAERLGAPVVMTTEGKGAIPASHPLALPLLAVPPLFDEADVLLILGSRAHLSRGPLAVPPDVTVIRIDVDPGELDQSVKPSIAIEADAHEAAVALARSRGGRHATDSRRRGGAHRCDPSSRRAAA